MKHLSKAELDAVQLALMNRSLDGFRDSRIVVAPTAGLLAVALLASDFALWRLALVLAVAAVGILRWARAGRDGDSGLRPAGTGGLVSPVVVVPVATVVLVSGGFDSPLLAGLLPMCFLVGVLASEKVTAAVTLICIGLVVTLAFVSWRGLAPQLMPSLLGGPVVQPTTLLWAKAGGWAFVLGWSAMASTALRRSLRSVTEQLIDARDEALETWDAHSRELTALSGELAHELKNPLANIKGLAVLVGREVTGRAAERLEVLQHEVTRMEEVLQEFLTFSKPLSPLSQEAVELVGLGRRIVALHEGLAQERRVTLRLREGPEVRVACDPRKVQQVLINLIQNALDASAPGAAVELGVEAGPDGAARVEVIDRGHGLSPETQAHLFEPGNTTKERGTGLGLALARGLARQHGGELTLVNREGGGCVATLTLPSSPQRPHQAGVT